MKIFKAEKKSSPVYNVVRFDGTKENAKEIKKWLSKYKIFTEIQYNKKDEYLSCDYCGDGMCYDKGAVFVWEDGKEKDIEIYESEKAFKKEYVII